MQSLLVNIQEKNKKTFKNYTKRLAQIIIVVFVVSLVLLIIDSNTYLTYAVLGICLSIFLSMIYVFLSFMMISSQYQLKLKHSIEIAYQSYIDRFNIENDQSYVFETEHIKLEPWYLIESYLQRDITFCLSDQKHTKLYFADAYSVRGTPPNRTYYLRGLYIVIGGVDGDMQYRDKESVSGKIVSALSAFYDNDIHNISRYTHKTPYLSGTVYQNELIDMPRYMQELILELSKKENVKRLSIAIKEGQLHIALELHSTTLPYVKSYKEEELKAIKTYVDDIVSLLEHIKHLVVYMRHSMNHI